QPGGRVAAMAFGMAAGHALLHRRVAGIVEHAVGRGRNAKRLHPHARRRSQTRWQVAAAGRRSRAHRAHRWRACVPVPECHVNLRRSIMPLANAGMPGSRPPPERSRMSSPSHAGDTPVTHRDQLVEVLASGEKPLADWRIGTEHEKFGFRLDDLHPPGFEGERGIEALLKGLTRFGWEPVDEHGRVVALYKDGASVTLEPAGQLELSGAPLEDIHQTCREVGSHLREVKAVADELRLGFLGMGFQPKWRREDMPWMPKGRYRIMRDYMPKVGTLGLDMMTRTCTVQVNLD